ncbi:MAG TPA: TlpA disulfide reductase family protein [Pirellulales bacterium]|nr:TlpA disulfide reductase family protein [Pirellulales bacterium]
MFGWKSGFSWHGSGKETVSKDANNARPDLGYFNLYADGRVGNSSLGFQIDVRDIFPRLPDSEQELAAGWDGEGPMEEKHHYQVKSSEAARTQIIDVTTSPMHDIYLLTAQAAFEFDLRRGMVAGAQLTNSQGWGIKGEGTGELKLTGSEMHGADSTSRLADEMQGYFEAADDYTKLTDQAENNADRSEPLCAEAKERLQSAASRLTSPILKTQAESLLAKHDTTAKYAVQAAERRAKVLGKEAANFETTDLDGHPFSLKNLQGKVAVLDFWYRGCGWCIRAMPQVNEVARSFQGRPVAVVGMNTDREIDDAKFVVEKMGLEYTNIKAEGLPERFQVEGFPTLVVIDQKGIVRDFHVGYSPTLAAQLSETIHALLAEQ